MKDGPKVSILCITYNQEKFVRKALESFISQKTSFDFEIIVGDDGSSDGTRGILREFELKYPGMFQVILREKNIGAIRNLFDIFIRARGDYIAFCEGDDFFTDENKLQLQVEFLDLHPDHAICFHSVKVFFENNEEDVQFFPVIKGGNEFTLPKLLESNFIPSNSVMYRRREYNDLPETDILPGDWYFHLYHARFGKIGFLNRVMSAYRRHSGGIWWDVYKDPDALFKKYGGDYFGMHFEVLKLYRDTREYRKVILKNIRVLFCRLARIDQGDGTSLVRSLLERYPDKMAEFLVEYVMENEHEKKRIERIVKQAAKDVLFVKSSKFWKLREWHFKVKFFVFHPVQFIWQYFKRLKK